MKKSVLTIVLTLTLCLGLYSMTALAVEPDTITVGGVDLADGQYVVSNGTVAVTGEPAADSTGYAYYKDGTLTLNRYSYTGTGDSFNSAAIYSDSVDLNIVLVDANKLFNTSGYTDDLNVGVGYGIRVTNGSLNISGDGSLDITAKTTGIELTGALTVGSDLYIAIKTDYGIEADSLEITGGKTEIYADVNGGDYGISPCGIFATYDLLLSGGELKVSAEYGCGIYADGIDISNAIFEIFAYDDAMYAGDTLSITNSEGTLKSTNEDAIHAKDDITISEATLTITADENGIYTNKAKAPVNIKNKSVVTITAAGRGIYTSKDESEITISDSQVTITVDNGEYSSDEGICTKGDDSSIYIQNASTVNIIAEDTGICTKDSDSNIEIGIYGSEDTSFVTVNTKAAKALDAGNNLYLDGTGIKVILTSTAEDGDAIECDDFDMTGGWLNNNKNHTIRSSFTLTESFTVETGKTLTIDDPNDASENAALTIKAVLTNNGTINNSGTLTIPTKTGLIGSGSVSGNGEFQIANYIDDDVIVPQDLVYNGTDQTETAQNGISLPVEVKIQDKVFTYLNRNDWSLSISPEKVEKAGDYIATYAYGSNQATKTFTVAKKAISGANVGEFRLSYTGSAQTPQATVTIDGLPVTGNWSDVTNVADVTTFTANGNFIGSLTDVNTGMVPMNIISAAQVGTFAPMTYNGQVQSPEATVTIQTGKGTEVLSGAWSDVTDVVDKTSFTLNPSMTNFTGSLTDIEDGMEKLVLTPENTNVILQNTSMVYSGEYQVQSITKLEATSGSLTFTVGTANYSYTGDTSVFGADGYKLTVTGTANCEGSFDVPFEVKKKDLRVTPSQKTIVYGDEPSCDGATWSGFVSNENASALDGTLSFSYNYTQYGDVGEYVITPGGVSSDNYEIVFLPSTLVVQPLTVEFRWKETTFDYDGVAHLPTATVTNSVNGDKVTLVVEGARTAAGTYTATATATSDTNYVVPAGVSTEFTINKAPVTIAASNQRYHIGTKLPDTETPVLGKHYTIDGLFGEDSIGIVTMKYQKDGEDVTPDVNKTGTYDIIMVVTDVNPNYEVSLVNGKLTYYYTPIYKPVVVDTEGGDVIISNSYPAQGQTVTITPKPDEGMMVDTVTVTDSKGNEIEVTKHSNGTYSFKQPAGKVTIKVTFKPETCPSEAFTDLDPNAWYHDAVDYVLRKGLMNGVGGDKFDPSGTTSRAMIVTILWRMEGEPAVNYLMQFEDVPAESWYTEAVRWAASEKIVEGWNGKFNPMGEISREQFAAILWRYAKYKGYDVSVGEDTNILSYEDAFSVSEYAIPAMQWACGAGLMQGDSVNLTPKADATRAQAAALFLRFCENVTEK